METLIHDLGPSSLLLAVLITSMAGFVKGAVGFGLPIIMISGLGSFLPVETALAALILPVLATSLAQALRQGPAAAVETVKRFRVFLIVGFVFLISSAQLVLILPEPALFLVIGIPVSIFAVASLAGWQIVLRRERRKALEVVAGALAGAVGGVSGVWGPPTVAYLTAVNTSKRHSVRAQGVIYSLGAMLLLIAHLRTGILSAATLPLSALMLVPAGIGMWAGFSLQDRLDQKRFRQVTLIVLTVASLNLIRRGLFA